jgi:hypothetical protein
MVDGAELSTEGVDGCDDCVSATLTFAVSLAQETDFNTGEATACYFIQANRVHPCA